MTTRRVRAFKRWMNDEGIDCSDALLITDNTTETEEEGLSVKALCDLKEGDVVATIPNHACLTIKTSGAKDMIEAAGLDGYLGLSVALMYEISLGETSPWAGYLQLLPHSECLPLVWTLDEVDLLLCGTELHKTVKEDKALVYEDWKECILPLVVSSPLKLNPKLFGPEQYFAAKSLIASRSFEIDDYHGFGMVPLADLFNHKTGAEDVHFTSVPSHGESESDVDNSSNDEYENSGDDEQLTQNSHSRTTRFLTAHVGRKSQSVSNLESSSTLEYDPTILEMIIIKDVKAGSEVFNTYGSLGNAALLHRYGFTEPDNPYDIVNIDLEVVLQWSLSLFSSRHYRARLSLWRRLNYSGCVSQDTEYFEISSCGEPQVELLVLLYIMSLAEEAYQQLDMTVATAGNLSKFMSVILSKKSGVALGETSEMSKNLLLTRSVRDALVSLADIRESFYGSNSVEDDIETLKRCSCKGDRKLYHSLMLRVSERRILEKLRTYAAAGARSFKTAKSASTRKKLKGR